MKQRYLERLGFTLLPLPPLKRLFDLDRCTNDGVGDIWLWDVEEAGLGPDELNRFPESP